MKHVAINTWLSLVCFYILQNCLQYERIILVFERICDQKGDLCGLKQLRALKQQKQLVSYFLISINSKWPKGIILLGNRVKIQRTCVSINQLRGEIDNGGVYMSLVASRAKGLKIYSGVKFNKGNDEKSTSLRISYQIQIQKIKYIFKPYYHLGENVILAPLYK